MSAPASERWLADLTDAADIDGVTVHAALTVDLDIDSTLTIRRIHANADRAQGLVLDADDPLVIGDTAETRIVLWSDTAPETVQIDAHAGRLTIWNVWSDDGAVQAWIGAAGLRREPLDGDSDAGARLLASDGHPDADVDLELELLIDGTV